MVVGNRIIINPIELFKDIFNDLQVFKGWQISGGSTNSMTGNRIIVINEQSSIDDSQSHTFLVSIRGNKDSMQTELKNINILFSSLQRSTYIEYEDYDIYGIYMKKPIFTEEDAQGRARWEFEIIMNIFSK